MKNRFRGQLYYVPQFKECLIGKFSLSVWSWRPRCMQSSRNSEGYFNIHSNSHRCATYGQQQFTWRSCWGLLQRGMGDGVWLFQITNHFETFFVRLSCISHLNLYIWTVWANKKINCAIYPVWHVRSTGIWAVRLVGGGNTREGRVEIYIYNEWGTVCDDSWGMNDARVVCRQLGFGPPISAPGSAHFGQGSGSILLDDVQCDGSEPSLSSCTHNGVRVHNCQHVEDAGAVCSLGEQ